jgi:hypothetical protein
LATTDAIAFLGDTLVAQLDARLNSLMAPVDVRLSTPDEFKTFAPRQPAVTIFLYQVGINGEMRNASPRTGAHNPPALPLECHFLVTPWTQTAHDAYRIIGAIAQFFYDHAVLGSGDLLGDKVWSPDDTVEIMMESLPVEQQYDIWDPTDIPYKLSLAYLARVISIDSALSTAAAPVAVATFTNG